MWDKPQGSAGGPATQHPPVAWASGLSLPINMAAFSNHGLLSIGDICFAFVLPFLPRSHLCVFSSGRKLRGKAFYFVNGKVFCEEDFLVSLFPELLLPQVQTECGGGEEGSLRGDPDQGQKSVVSLWGPSRAGEELSAARERGS